ncbi:MULTISPECIES: cytidine deaminase [Kordiimonas]|jgi:cytidine deaminase|uniref:cytidine deaminase n=1 Tax=Kordiimonas TaxID=288021 RepID=UPI00257E3D8B|nr:cytidine deaminase [Kordiimonas sp. UBA4487]
MATDMKALIDAAIKARDAAYAPYSNHPVGAAVLTKDGRVFAGANVENAAYPLGTCAEAGAISAMVLAGEREIAHVVVVGPGEATCTPCGGCRQKIREFAGPAGKPITICDKDGNILLETTSAELLPHAFGPENIDEAKG